MSRRGTPASGPLALLEERTRAVFRQLPKALAGQEEPLHQLRVAGRRLRVALPLVARKPEGRRVRRARRLLRALVRAAGRGRDLDVIVGLFESLGDGAGPESRRLLRRLRDARRRARRRLAVDLTAVDLARLRRHLATLASRGTGDVFTALRRAGALGASEGALVTQALARLGGRLDAEVLHAVRIRCRRLRYAAEVRDALGGRSSDAPRLLKALQQRLGSIHDAHVLAAWLARQADRAARAGQADLAAEARRRQAQAEALGRRHHAELLQADPAGIVREAVSAMVSAPRAA